MTVAIYLDRWLSEIEGDIEPSTREFYRANVERYLRPALGDRPLDGLTVEELESTFDDLVAGGGHDGGPLDPTTVAKAGSTLRRAFDRAVDDGVLPVNVARRCQLPSPSDTTLRSQGRSYRVWTSEEVRRFIDEIYADRYRALWIVAIGTGMRRGELLGLHWADVDLDRGVLRVRHVLRDGEDGPTLGPVAENRERSLTIDRSVVEALDWHGRLQELQLGGLERGGEARPDLVFTTTEGAPLIPTNISAHFSRLVERVDVPPVRLHDLRHTHAALLIGAGVDIAAVSRRLGHALLETTVDLYGDLLRARERDVAGRFFAYLYPDRRDAEADH